MQTFAERLNQLFETVRKPDGSPYTPTDVINGIHGEFSRVYLWKLRTGKALDPGFKVVQALAGFFDVDTSYFDPGNDTPPNTEMRYIQEIAEAAARLDETGRVQVLNMINYINNLREANP